MLLAQDVVKYTSESEHTHGLVCRVQRTVEVDVHPLGGESFKVSLAADHPSVAEAKIKIALVQGTPFERQELYKVQVSADGSAVREDDAEPELLEDEGLGGATHWGHNHRSREGSDVGDIPRSL
jgi:hypothetical protein